MNCDASLIRFANKGQEQTHDTSAQSLQYIAHGAQRGDN